MKSVSMTMWLMNIDENILATRWYRDRVGKNQV
jgi:hypothetical protein